MLVKDVPQVFVGLSLGLRDNEGNIEGSDSTDGAIEEVDAIRVHGFFHVTLKEGHQKGTQPVKAEGNGGAKGL